MMKRLALTLAVLAIWAGSPGIARAQALYTATPPTTATAPAYSNWADFTLLGSGSSPSSDSGVATLSLPFSFIFYGKTYTSVDVSADGILMFENLPRYCTGSYSSDCSTGHNIPSTTKPNAVVAFWWDDMYSSGAKGSWAASGTAGSRIFAIKLTAWGNYSTSSAISPREVQIDLHEDTGAIDVYYGAISAPSSSKGKAAVGIEDSAGTAGVAGLGCTNSSSRCTNAAWPTGQRITFAPAVDPDLLITDIVSSTLTPTTVNSQDGYSADVSVTVKNQGQNPATGFGFDLYLCNQTTVVPNDPTKCTLLRSHTNAETLAGKASATFIETGIQFVKPAAGTFYFGVYVDPTSTTAPNGAVNEALESNNAAVGLGYLIGVDLEGTLSGPANAGPGDDLIMQATIRNRGTDAAPAAFKYEIWLATGTTLNKSVDSLIYTGDVAVIGGGATLNLAPTVKLPMLLADGEYYYIMLVDTTAAITELSEGNNVALASGKVTLSAADLIVTQVSVRSPVAPYPETADAFFGEKLRVNFTVLNNGGGTAKDFYVCVFLSDSPVISLFDIDITPATAPLSNLTYVGGTTNAFAVDVTVPTDKSPGKPLADGAYWIGVIADCRNKVPESNKTNNKIGTPNSLRIRQPAIDLAPAQVQAPAAGAVGEVMPIYRILRNLGNRGNLDGSTAAFQFKYYLSSNELISSEDIGLALLDSAGAPKQYGEGRLDAGGVERGTDLVQIPGNISPGTYYVGVVMDPADKMVELDETNNAVGSLGTVEIAASTLRIESGSLPDALVGVGYLQQLVAAGGDGTYAWSVVDPTELPDGLALSGDGVLSGSPTAAGAAVFTVRVASAGHEALARLALRAVVPTGSLAILSTRMPTAVRGQDYGANLAAVGGVRPYAWLLAEGALPEGLTLSQEGKLAGKLAKANGSVIFKVSVTDAFGTRAVAEITMRAVEPGSLFCATDTLGKAQVGVPFRQTLQAVGGTAPFTWSLRGGALPDGLRLTGDSILGTPTKGGYFPIVVEIADAQGFVDSGAYILTVLPRPANFSMPEVLMEVKQGEAFSLNLSLNAKPHSTFDLFGGQLPPGLVLDTDGRISGSVALDATPGSYDALVMLTEDAGAQALVPVTIRVLPKPAEKTNSTGGGCSAGGAGLAPLAGLLALLPLARRRRRAGTAVAVAAAVGALLAAAPAQASYRLSPSISKPFQPLVGSTTVILDAKTFEQVVPLPFGFRLYGDVFTAVSVGCRGYLAFGNGSANNPQSLGIPTQAAPYPLVAPWWGSWECVPGSVTYTVTGVAPRRVVTFQWERVWYTPDTSGKAAHGATFQAALHETSGQVDFHYGPSNMSAYQPPSEDKAPRAAVGIQGAGGGVGLSGLPCTSTQPSSGSGAQCKVTDYTADTMLSFTQPPDLTLAAIYSDDLGYAGVPLRMGATVVNDGGEPAKNVTVRFYLSKDATFEPGTDTVLGTTRGLEIDVQQRRDVLLSPVLPITVSGSALYLFGVVDPDTMVTEDVESNNTSSARPIALGTPTADLTIGEVTVDKVTAQAGEVLQVTRTIMNVGNALSGPCAAPADCGSGRTCDAGRCRLTCSQPTDCPASLTCTNGICDTPACTSSDVCLPGEACQSGACAAKPITYAIFLSENPVVTLADRQLFPATGTEPLAKGITAFSENRAIESVTLPSDLQPGAYYLGVIVDPKVELPEVLVVNNSGATATPFTVVSDQLTLASRTLPDAQVNAPYSVRLQASGGDGTYQFNLVSGTLPAGLTLTPAGDVAGLPTRATDAVTFTAQVTSASATKSAQYTIQVQPANLPLVLVSQEIPAAEYGKPYTVSLSAVGGRPPYAWALAPGADLPPGLALGQDGTLEGVPGRDGAFAFGIEVQDTKGTVAAGQLTLTVVAPDRLRIATTALPDGSLGQAYKAPLQAVGGKSPYAWTVVEVQRVPTDPTDTIQPASTRLPNPLQLVTDRNGTNIVGVPAVVGTFVVTFKVVDISGAEDNASFVLNLRFERGLEIATVGLRDAIAGKTYTASLAAVGNDPTAKVTWTITCTPRYNDKGELLPCRQLPPPGIVLKPDGMLATPEIIDCNEPVEEPKGCPEGLACAADGHCVLKTPDPDEETKVIPARTIYSFLVRAEEERTGRSAVKALSITLRVDEPPPAPKDTGCATGAGDAGLWTAGLGLLSLLRRRGPRSRRGTRLAALLALVAVSAGMAACGGTTKPPVGRCDGVSCDSGLECDPGDGLCKCGGEGGTFCAAGGACTGGVCVYACSGVICERGTTLDPLDCKCKCGVNVCEGAQTCDITTRTCVTASRCVGVTCAGGMSCDPADGTCKCGGLVCPEGQVCKAGACSSDKCAGVACSGGALCDPADGVCKCGGAAGRLCAWGELCSCPGGAACKDEERRCVTSARCAGKVCEGGTTCDPADGQCRCGGPGGPICLYGQSCDVLRKACLGGDRCAGTLCDESLTCDPEDGVCKCGGLNGVNGEVCQAGDVCAHFTSDVRCVTACDPRLQKCGAGLGCYFDIYARVSYCAAPGRNPEGAGCRALTDCALGLHCQQLPNQTGKCRRYCNVPDGANGCPQAVEAQECVALDGAAKDVGACDSM